MINIDIAQLEKHIEDLRGLLKDGLLAAEVWDRETALSLAGYNPNPQGVALFTRLTEDIEGVLKESNFSTMGRYYMVDLSGNQMLVVMQHGRDLLEGIVLDTKKANLGIVLSMAIPKSIDAIAKARA